ncbi:hypothetical protein H6G81_15215 [Scytonema hofmannii FACHB-248]|uniref:Uncharacterized protein n=1 Tax=Scytonema hofmannii FACHB-248 TaxID=1842502 RepID=A0ABR8GRT6_9CYAN|nr:MULTISPECIES: hypothetical protein [Nostocales]MBD2605830.1 hypothetical protein [Scytonema hofmannii FACHB-248]
MSQHFFKDKAVERYDLQKSKLLTPFGCQDRVKNFGANLQPKYSFQRKIIFLASTDEFPTQKYKILSCLAEILRYLIAVGWNERYLLYVRTRSHPLHKEGKIHSSKHVGVNICNWQTNS